MRAALLFATLPACSLLDLLPEPTTPKAEPIEVGAVTGMPAPALVPVHGAVHRPDQDVAGTIELVIGAPDGSHGVVVGSERAWSIGPEGAVRAERAVRDAIAATAGPGGTWAVAEPGAVTLLDGTGATLQTLPITAVDIAWSPDGRYLAVATEDDVRIADVATGKKVATYQPEYGGGNTWWHPDGHTLFSSDAFRVYAWDVTTGEERGRFTNGLIEDLAVSPDGSTIWIWNGSDRPTRWDATTLTKQGKLESGSWLDMVHGGAMHAGGAHLLVDTRIIPVEGGPGWSVGADVEWQDADLSPTHDGMWLGTEEGLQRWTFLAEGLIRAVGPRQTWEGGYSKGGRLDQVAFTPDGAGLVASGRDGSLVRWDAKTGAKTWEHVHPCEDGADTPRGDRDCSIYGTGVHRDEAWVAFLDTIVQVPLSTGADAKATAYESRFGGRLADGRWVSLDDTPRSGRTPTGHSALGTVAVDDLVVGGRHMLGRLADGRLQPLDARGRPTGAALAPATDDTLSLLAISPDGTRIAEFAGEGTVIRDSRTGETVARTRGWNATFSPDGVWLASGLHAAQLIHLPTGAAFDVQPPGPGAVAALAFSADGRQLAIAEGDDEAGDQLWVVDVSGVAAAAGVSVD